MWEISLNEDAVIRGFLLRPFNIADHFDNEQSNVPPIIRSICDTLPVTVDAARGNILDPASGEDWGRKKDLWTRGNEDDLYSCNPASIHRDESHTCSPLPTHTRLRREWSQCLHLTSWYSAGYYYCLLLLFFFLSSNFNIIKVIVYPCLKFKSFVTIVHAVVLQCFIIDTGSMAALDCHRGLS